MAPRRSATSVVASAAARPALRRSARITTAAAAAALDTTANRITRRKAPVKPKSSRKECSTCGRKRAAASFPPHPPNKYCKHGVTTCNSCTTTHITYQLESVTFDKISCPECPQILHGADIKRLGTKQAFQRYDELERKDIVEKTPGWRWCLDSKCRAGQVHKPLIVELAAEPDVDVQERPRAKKRKAYTTRKTTKAIDEVEDSDHVCTCHVCGARACVRCDRPYHDGETCAAYQKRCREEIEASEKTIEKNCRKCPNEQCGKNIEKWGGCDSMYCTQCRTQFCWLCNTKYTDINTNGHAQGCVYARQGAFDPHAAPNAPGNAAFNALVADHDLPDPWVPAGPLQLLPGQPPADPPPGQRAEAIARHMIAGRLGAGGGGGGGAGGGGA